MTPANNYARQAIPRNSFLNFSPLQSNINQTSLSVSSGHCPLFAKTRRTSPELALSCRSELHTFEARWRGDGRVQDDGLSGQGREKDYERVREREWKREGTQAIREPEKTRREMLSTDHSCRPRFSSPTINRVPYTSVFASATTSGTSLRKWFIFLNQKQHLLDQSIAKMLMLFWQQNHCPTPRALLYKKWENPV